MYYNRTISTDFEDLLKSGHFSWIIPYVKKHEDLDILIGRNKSMEFCSVYRGLSRILRIYRPISKKQKYGNFKWDAADKYIAMYSDPKVSLEQLCEDDIEKVRRQIEKTSEFTRYYKEGTATEAGSEGFYQNAIQRKYGLLSESTSALVIVDKEAVIGYDGGQSEKKQCFNSERNDYKTVKNDLQKKYPKDFGKADENSILGNELDLIALDKDGYIHLMELKKGSNTSGIYMSPFQIGLYHRLFKSFNKEELKENIRSMIEQKKRLGLINPDWTIPEIQNRFIPELIICHRIMHSSCYPQKYNRVIEYIKDNYPRIYEDIRDIKVKDENLNLLCK